VIHHGVELELFPFRPRAEPRGRLIYSGRISAQKGIAVAIEALELLPGASLTLIGPRDPAFVEDPPERVAIRPPVPRGQLARVYGAHDVLVFPVLWNEPWGLVPLEAMAVGLPVIATGTGGGAEYLEHERNCLLVEPGDARGLADAADRLLTDSSLSGRLIEAGRETATKFSFARTAAEITSAAADLAAGREPTAGEPLAATSAAGEAA
jgi:glycosyltransferase involved in cell wall biosynthesis